MVSGATRRNLNPEPVVTSADGRRYPLNLAGNAEGLLHCIAVEALANHNRIGPILMIKRQKGLGLSLIHISVSYTHLDVYKRQRCNCTIGSGMCGVLLRFTISRLRQLNELNRAR